MKTKKIIWLVLILILLSVFGCQKRNIREEANDVQVKESKEENLNKEKVYDIVQANNQFALDLYQVYKNKEGNILFSPFSISSALAMTYEGAAGQTAQEMKNVFHFPQEEALREGYKNLFSSLNIKQKEYQLNLANALWVQKEYKLLDKYYKTIEENYLGKAANLDFIGNTKNSRETINQWIEEKTNNRIKDLLNENSIDNTTRVVLTNAIYFKGEWVLEFNKENTQEEDFRVTSDKTTKVQMMKRNDEEALYNYGENEKIQIIELAYLGDDLSMLVILPKENNLSEVENDLSIKKFDEWKKLLEKQRVNLYLPKFKFEETYSLNQGLIELGMPLAFSKEADFSKMNGNKNLFISNVLHKAFIEVNEEGSEAAAATAVIMSLKSIDPSAENKTPTFRADHPFLFIIQQKESGNILFLGRVSNPNN